MADNRPNTDQDINNTPPNHPDEYATKYGGASNPDLDVARDNRRAQQKPTPADTSLGGSGLSQDAYATQTGNPNATGDTSQTGGTSPYIPGGSGGGLGNTGRASAGGSEDRLGNVGAGTPGLSGQTTNMDATGPMEHGDITGRPRDEERTGNDDRGLSGSTGSIGATAYGTYNAPNDRTGLSNTTTGGGFADADTDDTDDAGTPVMRRGGDLAETDVMSGDPGTDSIPQAPTDTTTGEDYSTGPRRTDPEEELLDPGYEPHVGSDEMGPDRAGHRVPPNVPGIPDQTGTLDQTTYTTGGNDLGSDAGTEQGTGQP